MRRSTVVNAVVASTAAMLVITAVVYVTADSLSNKLLQILSPLPSATTAPTLGWNGLPEGYKFDPYLDLEHPFDRVGSNNPWSPEVCCIPCLGGMMFLSVNATDL